MIPANLHISSFKFKYISSKESDPRFLLLLVHGRTGNIKLLEWYSKRFQIEHLAYLLIEAPYVDQRPDQTDPGFSWYLKNYEGLEETRKNLKLMFGELEAQGVKSEQTYWLGFSQGACMGLDSALRIERQFGGFVCVSGLCIQHTSYPKDLSEKSRDQRIFITHGTRDEIISLENAEKTYQSLRDSQVPFEFKVYDKPHSFNLKIEVPEIEAKIKAWVSTS